MNHPACHLENCFLRPAAFTFQNNGGISFFLIKTVAQIAGVV